MTCVNGCVGVLCLLESCCDVFSLIEIRSSASFLNKSLANLRPLLFFVILGEIVPDSSKLFIVQSFELPSLREVHETERIVHQKDLNDNIGRLNYLNNLMQNEYRQTKNTGQFCCTQTAVIV